ncbi:uncharacterized protein TRAVEDRAFT_47364 [Trametes versicolor FP-101664 SS1]|uniref:uncharacterized protein n=1 Tax=Trametes versicolor (strain FP-101664) TaxID=717944 RepID=UPI0004623DC1|nr:uncharacterized protein TRAVEDRAFT_47364 [Trametes versicolor FP-101664 SS1]EIW58195.1 hypothetical protein TRAVEDRAFT_47364 [Trametes versicolor FP-101664 SS1]
MTDSVSPELGQFERAGSSLPTWSLRLPETRTIESKEIDALMRARRRQLSSQMLTPPSSDTSSTTEGEDYAYSDTSSFFDDAPSVSVSATFDIAACLLPTPPDLALISSDGVIFHTHSAQLLSISSNDFNHLILPDQAPYARVDAIVCVPEPSAVLNIVLHTAYQISCEDHQYPLDTLIAAVDAMASYGLFPQVHLRPLIDRILALSPTQPLAVYALASRHDWFALAQPVSSHLLSLRLDSLTDELVRTVAAPYLSKLFLLHIARLGTLKTLLRAPPQLHPCTPECDFAQQKKLTTAWVLAAGYLAWDARADVSPGAIEGALASLGPRISCDLCKLSLEERIKDVIARWSFAQRTI